MANGWSIAGKRLEIKPGFPAGKLVLDGETAAKLKAKGSFPLQIAGKPYTFERKQGLMVPKDTLRSADGQVVPPTSKHVPSVRAAAGSLCAQHTDRQALVECPRCGSYACDQCTGPDLTHCRACTERLLATAEKHARDLMFMAPAFLFVVIGGMLGALLGVGAGAAAVAIARKTDSAGLKWAAAIGLYVVAAIAFVVAAGALQLAAGR
jgi:hypothetical protein